MYRSGCVGFLCIIKYVVRGLYTEPGKVLGPFPFIQFHPKFVDSNTHFDYEKLTDLLEIWHSYR